MPASGSEGGGGSLRPLPLPDELRSPSKAAILARRPAGRSLLLRAVVISVTLHLALGSVYLAGVPAPTPRPRLAVLPLRISIASQLEPDRAPRTEPGPAPVERPSALAAADEAPPEPDEPRVAPPETSPTASRPQAPPPLALAQLLRPVMRPGPAAPPDANTEAEAEAEADADAEAEADPEADADAAAPTPPATEQAAVQVPVAAHDNPPPVYPGAARRRGWEGRVRFGVDVDATGAVTALELLESSGHTSLDQAARDAVTQWRFEPARRGEVAIAGHTEVVVRFQLVE